MLRNVSVKLIVPLLLVLPVLLVALVLIGINAAQAHAAARASIEREMGQVLARVNERLDVLLKTPPRASAINASMILEGAAPAGDVEAWRPMLAAQTSAMDMLSGITWANAEGDVAWVFRYPGKDRPEWGLRNAGTDGRVLEFALDDRGEIIEQVGGYAYDPRSRPWYIGAINAPQPTYLEPYAWVNADGSKVTLGLPFVQRVEDAGGETLGVLSTEISLNDLSEFLQTLRVGDSGFSFIMDEAGQLVASSLGAAVATESNEPLRATNSENERIRVAAAAVGAEDQGHAGEVLLRTAGYARAPGLSWRVVVGLPEAEILAPLREGRDRALVATAIAVLMTIALGMGIGRVMTKPISGLVSDVHRIGEGDLEHQVSSEASSEMVALSEAINAMTRDLRDRVRLRESLLLAMEVQKNLLPDDAPTVDGLDLAGHCTYCDETGGDYYDYLDIHGLESHTAALAIGDVVGHGIAAAMLMATARGILRSRCNSEDSLGELLTHLNRLLYVDTGGYKFMTMLLTVLDTERGTLTWASAGHDPPFLYKADRGAFTELDGGSFPLGIVEDAEYSHCRVNGLGEGDVLVLATDGLWEAHNQWDEMFGQDRVKRIVAEHADRPASAIVEALRSAHAEHCAQRSPEDDITLIIAKLTAVGGAREPA